jgi:uncharacterized protein YgiM (DUF1202 family)
MKKPILIALAAIIALSMMSGIALADTTYAPVGRLFTIFGETPIYTDTSLSKVAATLQNGQKCIVVSSAGNLVEVYTIDTHKAGWMIWSNSVSGQTIVPGIILSSSASLRETASTGSRLIMAISNGEIVSILGESNGWYNVEYQDRHTNTTKTGFIRTDFVLKYPEFIILQKTTDIYAMPTSGSKKVGQVATPTALVIIGEYNGYLCVNLRQASGFIRKTDVGW